MGHFWVVNISKCNVTLSDLGLSIPAGRAFNLLDSKHFSYKKEDLSKSLKEGSLYKKRDKIKKCDHVPDFTHAIVKSKSTQPVIMRNRSAVKVDEPLYEELIFSDEQYAEEMSELFDEE